MLIFINLRCNKNSFKIKKEINFNEYTIFTPDIREKEINNVIEVLKSGWITTGNKTKEFERKIEKYCETKKLYV